MNAARGSGRGDGGVRNERASTFDWVLSWMPTKMFIVPITESPKSENEIFVDEMTQPDKVSVLTNFETEWPSWSGWTNATNKFNRQIMRNCATIEAWIDQKAVAGSLFW